MDLSDIIHKLNEAGINVTHKTIGSLRSRTNIEKTIKAKKMQAKTSSLKLNRIKLIEIVENLDLEFLEVYQNHLNSIKNDIIDIISLEEELSAGYPDSFDELVMRGKKLCAHEIHNNTLLNIHRTTCHATPCHATPCHAAPCHVEDSELTAHTVTSEKMRITVRMKLVQ